MIVSVKELVKYKVELVLEATSNRWLEQENRFWRELAEYLCSEKEAVEKDEVRVVTCCWAVNHRGPRGHHYHPGVKKADLRLESVESAMKELKEVALANGWTLGSKMMVPRLNIRHVDPDMDPYFYK